MKIEFEIADKVVESYLKHYNAVNGTSFKLSELNQKQFDFVKKAFAELASGEIEMRTDDHSGFENEKLFEGLV